MKLIYSIILSILLPLLLCGPGKAQHSGPYVGAFFGGNVPLPAKSSDDLGDFTLKFAPALQGSAVAGWDFEPGNKIGEGRIELEYTRRSNRLDQVKFTEGSFAGGGNLAADSLLLNFYGVFHDAGRLAPYVGLGVGAARIEATDLTVTGQPMGSGSATVFAYQLGIGVDFEITEQLNVDLGYRFFNSTRPKFTETNGRTFEMDYLSHNAVFGVRVGF